MSHRRATSPRSLPRRVSRGRRSRNRSVNWPADPGVLPWWKMRKILLTLLCATAVVASAADRRAPGFDLMDNKGGWHDLADYRGRPLVLAFIETTCPNCATFAEKLEQLKGKFGDKVGVLAVVV